jgi:hypothetical protein
LRLRQSLAFIFLPFKKKSPISKSGTPFFIKGNPDIKEILKQKLSARHFPVSEKEKNDDAIIFCETNSFSWKTIIANISNEPERHLYYLHGSGTHALVGSDSGGNPGKVFEL